MSTIQKPGRGPDLAKIGQNLEAVGRAIIAPGTLGKDAISAFVALKGLGELTKLLPPKAADIASRVLVIGMQNLMHGADPTAREAVRGYASSLAVARGLVPDGLLEKAVGKEQKQALYTAAKHGDTATVKSILRHNKKAGVAPKPATSSAPGGAAVSPGPAAQTPAAVPSHMAKVFDRARATSGKQNPPFEHVLQAFMEHVSARLEKDIDAAKRAQGAAGAKPARTTATGAANREQTLDNLKRTLTDQAQKNPALSSTLSSMARDVDEIKRSAGRAPLSPAEQALLEQIEQLLKQALEGAAGAASKSLGSAR